MAILPLTGSILICSDVVNSAPRRTDYFCYERTAVGRMVDLTEMCQRVQPRATSTTSTAPGSRTNAASEPSEGSADRVRIESQARKKKVEFSNYSYDGRMLVGTLKNRTGKPISDISVIYEVEVREGEGRWRSVDNGRISANNREVEKGGKTNFSTSSMRSGDRIKIIDVEFN